MIFKRRRISGIEAFRPTIECRRRDIECAAGFPDIPAVLDGIGKPSQAFACLIAEMQCIGGRKQVLNILQRRMAPHWLLVIGV